MTMIKSIADLFDPAPPRWGMRGDPYLWREMAEAFQGVALPPTVSELAVELERTFESLTNQPLSFQDPIFLKRHSHGGMSSGCINTQFWREVAIPLLLSRYEGLI